MSDNVRLNININTDCREALYELAERRQTTVTEIVRRAISVYKFVEDEVVDGTSELIIKDADGKLRELKVLA